MHRRTAAVIACAAFFASVLGLPARAQPFPSKPIRVIVPYPAGGVVDVIACSVGERMTQTIGQTSVIKQAGIKAD